VFPTFLDQSLPSSDFFLAWNTFAEQVEELFQTWGTGGKNLLFYESKGLICFVAQTKKSQSETFDCENLVRRTSCLETQFFKTQTFPSGEP